VQRRTRVREKIIPKAFKLAEYFMQIVELQKKNVIIIMNNYQSYNALSRIAK
jgi:hypothetical protein